MTDPFSLLVVCTGNVCRSPATELLLRAALGPGSGVVVRSAGTRALTGRPVDPGVAGRLTALGAIPSAAAGEPFAARQLTVRDLAQADLVLTAEREHRSAVVAELPRVLRRTFTLLEFTDLAVLAHGHAGAEGPAGGPAERLAWLVDRVPAVRPLRSAGSSDDVPDPFGRDDEMAAAVVDQLATAVQTLCGLIAPPPGAGAGNSRSTTTVEWR